MVTIKVFLASSSELEEDRRAFEIFLGRKNKEWVTRGVFLELVLWEDFLDVLSKTRLQDEYNAAIRACDLFVMLFWTKVGPYTEEEFDAAVGQFRANDKPFILVYFKGTPRPAGTSSDADRASLEAFKAKLKGLGHFKTDYDNLDRLTAHFAAQLDKLAARGFISLDREEEGRWRRPFQAPVPDADRVPRPEVQALEEMLVDAQGTLRSVTVGLHGFGGVGKTTVAGLLCAHEGVRRACRDGILWVPVGKNPADLRAQLADLVVALVGDAEGCQTLPGARSRLQSLLAGRRVLVVLDDVWNEAHVRDVLQASAGCARLITTRNVLVLPSDAQTFDLGAMAAGESTRLLGAGLPPGLEARLDLLAARLGRWPLLLGLVNRVLRLRISRQKTPAAAALDAVESELRRKGVRAFDPAGPVHERDQAVAATIDASLDLLQPDERQRYAELAIFPQDVPVPLDQVAELWELTGKLDLDAATALVASRLDPLSLLEYSGAASTVRLHEVFRSYLAGTLVDAAGLHAALADAWGDRPAAQRPYAWRWLAFHRAAAIAAMAPADRGGAAQRLVSLVGDTGWQERHEIVVGDLPALREALVSGMEAAVSVDGPGATALVVEAADALRRFDAAHASAEPVFEAARNGDLKGALRRTRMLEASADDHWRQALLLAAAWLAPAQRRDDARALVADVQRVLGPEQPLHDLLAWVRADVHGDPPPAHPPPALSGPATDAMIEQILRRVGGADYDRELIARAGLDPGAQNPDMPTRGLYLSDEVGEATATTRYLAEVDGPWLVAYAAAEPARGAAAFDRYLSVYTNYSYAEYRHATMWLLLRDVLRFPRADGGPWVRDTLVRVLGAALGGARVEFEDGLAIAVRALRARIGDAAARQALETEADRLVAEAPRMRSGPRREASDTWALEKRRMLAHAQALGWLLGDRTRAARLLAEAQAIADSGFAGFQAQACLALAEGIEVVERGGHPAALDAALDSAREAAHNVQDVSFCARITSRVNAIRRHWWTPFDLDQRARQLGDGIPRREFAGLHLVGYGYPGRRPDALRWPAWAQDESSLEALARLYQRSMDEFLRLSGPERTLVRGEEVPVPDRGFVPHLAARLAAEALAQAGDAPLALHRAQLLRGLVAHAIPSPTALDAVLQRLALADGRREPPPSMAEIGRLESVLARRAGSAPADAGSELIAGRLPA